MSGDLPRCFILRKCVKSKILSIFIDESGDFGKFESHSPNYYVAMVFHDQSIDISQNINQLEDHLSRLGYPQHAIHTGPIIRKEQFYKHDLIETRRKLFNALFHFMRKLDIHYICPKINKAECQDDIESYSQKLSKVIYDELKSHYDYFSDFDILINYYDNGQNELSNILRTVFDSLFPNVEWRKVRPVDYKLFQVADLICTMELTNDKALRNAFTKSEMEFFYSPSEFKKNLYKQRVKKKL